MNRDTGQPMVVLRMKVSIYHILTADVLNAPRVYYRYQATLTELLYRPSMK